MSLVFFFILYFIGMILLEKSYQKREVQREYKIGDNHVGGLSIEGGLNFLHTDNERLKGQILEP